MLSIKVLASPASRSRWSRRGGAGGGGEFAAKNTMDSSPPFKFTTVPNKRPNIAQSRQCTTLIFFLCQNYLGFISEGVTCEHLRVGTYKINWKIHQDPLCLL
jgi:hypothetical protein